MIRPLNPAMNSPYRSDVKEGEAASTSKSNEQHREPDSFKEIRPSVLLTHI